MKVTRSAVVNIIFADRGIVAMQLVEEINGLRLAQHSRTYLRQQILPGLRLMGGERLSICVKAES
jgi:hypothetical protein